MENQYTNCKIISNGELVVGDSDSLLLYGCDAQQQLRDFSKAISMQVLNGNEDLEYLIQSILSEIEKFQNLTEKKPKLFWKNSNEKKRALLIKHYNNVLVYIDKMELALKLQEVQIIKDTKLFERMNMQLEDASIRLKELISYGSEVLEQQSKMDVSEELKSWYERLAKRLNDLRISDMIAQQTKAQMKLMLQNNTRLLDKILEAVSGTIPIWRNQITILLGIECVNRDLLIQNKIAEITQQLAIDGKEKNQQKNLKNREISEEKILQVNAKLKKVLDELSGIEKKDSNIRLELSSSLQ